MQILSQSLFQIIPNSHDISSDSELMTMEIVAEYQGIETDILCPTSRQFVAVQSNAPTKTS